MEHLRWSYDVDQRRPSVPYLCAGFEHYICVDIDLFRNWPLQRGWFQDEETPMLELARQCQAWLFFGLIFMMTDAIGKPFEIDDYLKESDPQLVDSTHIELLIGLLQPSNNYLKSTVFSRGYPNYPVRCCENLIDGQTTWRCMCWISNIIRQFENQSTDFDLWESGTFKVLWSTMMLLELLIEECIIANPFMPTFDSQQYLQPSGLTYGIGFEIFEDNMTIDHCPVFKRDRSIAPQIWFPCQSRHIRDALGRLGHCESILTRIKPSALQVYRILATVPKLNLSHRKCGSGSCKAYDTCEQTYVKRHTASCPCDEHCRLVGICSTTLINLINVSAHAVVRSRLDKDGALAVEIVDGTNIAHITAISHVWAGGLGNFEENKQYTCQLSRIHRYLVRDGIFQRGSSTVHYWLDTLCIPISGAAKTKAIEAMAYSYAKCGSVLVIDPDLIVLDTNFLSSSQILQAVLYSPWMTRSWTLQEASLSVSLKFAFANTIVPSYEIDPKGQLADIAMMQGLWDTEMAPWDGKRHAASLQDLLFALNSRASTSEFRMLRTMPELESPHISYQPKFVTAWNELSKRSTTKKDDLSAILGILLGLSAGEILELPTADRMHAILKTQKKLPISLLFAPIEPNTKGWCPLFPTSLDGTSSSVLKMTMGIMTLTDQSLLKITDLGSNTLVRTRRNLPTQGTVLLYDFWSKIAIELQCTQSSIDSSNSREMNLVLISAELDRDRDVSQGRALCLRTERRDTGHIQAKFLTSCTWRRVPLQAKIYAEIGKPHLNVENVSYQLIAYERESERLATEAYSRLYPKGSEIIPTDGTGLKCGFRAAINTLNWMKEDGFEVSVPSLDELESTYNDSEFQSAVSSFQPGSAGVNTNNYYVDQVAATVKQWAESHFYTPLRMGWVMPGRPPMLVPWESTSEEQTPIIFFVHNNATTIEDDTIFHFSGLAPSSEPGVDHALTDVEGANFLGNDNSIGKGRVSEHGISPGESFAAWLELCEGETYTKEESVIKERGISEEYPLLLDMELTVRQLAWSRTDFFPFAGTALNVARVINLFFYLPHFNLVYLALYYFLTALIWKLYFLIAVFVGLCLVRIFFMYVEYRWLRQVLLQNLQRLWAESFKPTARHNDKVALLYPSQYRVLALIITAQSVLLVTTVGWSLFLVWKQMHMGPSNEIDVLTGMMGFVWATSMDDPLWLSIAKPLILATSFELSARFLIVVLGRPWQAQCDVLELRRQSLDLGLKTPFDLQYDFVIHAITTVGVIGILALLSAIFWGFYTILRLIWSPFDGAWWELLLVRLSGAVFLMIPLAVFGLLFLLYLEWQRPNWARPVLEYMESDWPQRQQYLLQHVFEAAQSGQDNAHLSIS